MLNSIFKIWLNPTGTGTAAIEGYRQYSSTAQVYLTEMEGWYSETGIVLTTKPKLLGDGTYLTGVQNDNKSIRLTFASHHTNELAMLTFLDTFRSHLINQVASPTLAKLQIVFTTAPGYTPTVRTETLNAYLTGVEGLEQHSNGEDVSFSLLFTATDPAITIG